MSKFDVAQSKKVATALGVAFKVVKGVMAKQPVLPLVFAALPAILALQDLDVTKLPSEATDIQENEAHELVTAFYEGSK